MSKRSRPWTRRQRKNARQRRRVSEAIGQLRRTERAIRHVLWKVERSMQHSALSSEVARQWDRLMGSAP